MTSVTEKSIAWMKAFHDLVLENMKIESAKQELRLEKKLTFKFQETIENQMADLGSKTERKLLSKYQKDFKNLEARLYSQMKTNCPFSENSISTEDFHKLITEIKDLKKDLQNDWITECEEMKKKLKETSKSFIEGAFYVKCEEMKRNSVDDVHKIKSELKYDLNLKVKQNFQIDFY